MKEKAIKHFLQDGFSCSESVMMAAIEKGLVEESLLNCASSFSGAMSSGCLCGTIAASQMIIGAIHGRNKSGMARKLAKEFVDKFKEKNKATCCRVLSGKFEHHSPERKQNCAKLVASSIDILEEILKNAELELKQRNITLSQK